MIFVTVGTQLRFDRLVRAVDKWVEQAGLGRDEVFGQVGPGSCLPENFDSVEFLSPAVYKEKFDAATTIVAHAGVGTILSALSSSKPILIMPRQAKFREQRNDHQVATARRFNGMGGIHVAMDADELVEKLGRVNELVQVSQPISPYATPELIQALDDFINQSVRSPKSSPDMQAGVEPAGS